MKLKKIIFRLDLSKEMKFHRVNNLGLNQQLILMGLEARNLFSEYHAEKIIHQTDSNFDLVMISEYFDESMVLMADLFCWPLENVVGLRANARLGRMKVRRNRTPSQ